MGYPEKVIVGNDTIGPVSDYANFGGLAKFDSSGILKWYQ